MNKNPQETSASIYSRLLAGEDEEAIAKSFLDALNAAKTRYAEFQKLEEERAAKAAEEKIEAAERQKEQDTKVAEMNKLLHDIVEYTDRYYPSLLEGEEITEKSLALTAGAIVDMLDRAVEPKPKWVIDPFSLFWL